MHAHAELCGQHLPEPIPTNPGGFATGTAELNRSLSVAFMFLLESLSPKGKLALWINSYNALCANLVITALKHGPVASINELSTKEQKVWNMPAGSVGGVVRSLDEIEHKILRKVFAEPCVHACIVCASASW